MSQHSQRRKSNGATKSTGSSHNIFIFESLESFLSLRQVPPSRISFWLKFVCHFDKWPKNRNQNRIKTNFFLILAKRNTVSNFNTGDDKKNCLRSTKASLHERRKDSNSFPFQNKKTILKFSVETFWLLVTLEILFCCSFPEEVSDSTKFDAD